MNARKIPWIEIGILLIAVVLRVALLDIKPAHFDEGVNGWFADQMTKQGFFRYDPGNYHGPLHFYSVFISQTLFGRNLWAMRISAILPSLLAVWMMLRFREFFGPLTVRLAAVAMAVSPACVFYGRYSIHESWMMLFQISFFWGLLGVWQKGDRKFYLTAVFSAIGMMLIKETYVIHMVSFALAALVLGAWQKLLPSRAEPVLPYRNLLAGNAAGMGALLFIFFAIGLLMPEPHPKLFVEILNRLAEKGLTLPVIPWYAGIGIATALLGGFWVWAFPRIPAPGTLAAQWSLSSRAATLGVGLVVIVFFYSGNFLAWSTLNGVHDTFLAWFHTGVEAAGHEKTTYDLLPEFTKKILGPESKTVLNSYWIQLLWRYEWPALLGFAACFRYIVKADARLRYLAIYAGGVLLAFSLIPYKTPWCLLSNIWPFFLLFGAIVEEAADWLGAGEARIPIGVGIFLVVANLAPSLRLNFSRFDDPKEPYVYVQTFRESRTFTDPVLGMAKRDPRFYHVKGQLFLDSYYPLPWVFGDFTQLGYQKTADRPPAGTTSDFVVAEHKDAAQIEERLSGDYFKKPFRLRDAQADCVVYFRASTYGDWFRGEAPTTYPVVQDSPVPEGTPAIPQDFTMKAVAAATALVFVSVIAAIALASAADGLSLAAAVAALIVGLGAAWMAIRSTTEETRQPLGAWDWIVLAAFALVSLRGFLWVVGERGNEVFVLSPNNLGDMSLHIAFIRYLASGVPFWPESPILTGAPLTYPLGVDLFNSLLELCGVGTFRGIVWVGLVSAALTGFALWRWGGAFTVAAFLFNGGLAGFAVFQSGQLEDFQAQLVWKNFFLSMFVTQRGLLLALPAGLLLLTSWREEFFRNKPPVIARWLQFVFYAAMPLFSLHTFIFLSALLAGIFVLRPPSRRPLALFVGAAVIPATMGVLLITGNFSSSGGLHMAWTWLPNFYPKMEDKGWLSVLKDFGLTLPLGLATIIIAIWKKDAEARTFAGLAGVVFLVCCVVAFSRWEWDNMKLMMWCWLALAPYLWNLVIRPLKWPAQAAICFVLFFSGAVSLIGGLDARHGYSIANRSELASWQAAVENIPATDRFAATPDYNHPLVLLGRKLACGYDGHLWSHGLNYGEQMTLTKDALRGAVSWQIAAPKLNVQWGALRRMDRPDFVNAGIGAEGIGALYDLRPCLKPDPSIPAPLPPPPRPVGLPL